MIWGADRERKETLSRVQEGAATDVQGTFSAGAGTATRNLGAHQGSGEWIERTIRGVT
jgi:hypothetical protein